MKNCPTAIFDSNMTKIHERRKFVLNTNAKAQ